MLCVDAIFEEPLAFLTSDQGAKLLETEMCAPLTQPMMMNEFLINFLTKLQKSWVEQKNGSRPADQHKPYYRLEQKAIIPAKIEIMNHFIRIHQFRKAHYVAGILLGKTYTREHCKVKAARRTPEG
ncbi:unnamed protein product [Caenorhabditis sp. 36 PRJEB53466]|nr:unnamed protein product [Caenorhabditis sp. 36 PRJEB53466]